MARVSTIFTLLAVGVLCLGASPAQAAEATEARIAKSVCVPPSEGREDIKEHHLLEPFAVLKSAAAQFKAEALSAKLCHQEEEFVYEIALLHRDGRFVHVVMNASTGKFIGVRHGREPMSKM
jgi:uncharacterized membrane protein YkoI